VALRASRAAIDARFENTNARMLKTNPATEATFPQFPARKSILCQTTDYVTARSSQRRAPDRSARDVFELLDVDLKNR